MATYQTDRGSAVAISDLDPLHAEFGDRLGEPAGGPSKLEGGEGAL
jgi:hypothetical protein